MRGGALRFVPVVIAVAYPFAVLASVSSFRSNVAERSTTFIFFGVAVIVGGWLSGRLSGPRHRLERLGTIAVAVVCFLGSMLYGSGSDWSYVPGPYLVGAGARSVTPASLEAAEWVSTHLAVGSRFAADRDNGALLGAIGHVDAVTAIGGGVDVAPLFFDRSIGPKEISLIRKADVRYVLLDERLATGPPLDGTYIEQGEPDRPITLAELHKWNSVPGARRIYDNGPIRIYDLASLLGLSPTAPLTGPIDGSRGTGLDWIVLLAAGLTAGAWLVRLWRLRGRVRLDEQAVVFWATTVIVAGLFGAFIIVPSGLSPRLVGLVVLAVLFASALRPLRSTVGLAQNRELATAPSSYEPPLGAVARPKPANGQLALACAGLALVAVGSWSLVAAAHRQWSTPAEMSVLYNRSGRAVAVVKLGSAGPIASTIELSVHGDIVYSRPLARTTSAQSIVLPSTIPLLGAQVQLYSGDKKLRQVDG